jgi:undecaprenyl pyrophosphate synthase
VADSCHAVNYFSDTIFHEFKEKDLIKAIKFYQENKARL